VLQRTELQSDRILADQLFQKFDAHRQQVRVECLSQAALARKQLNFTLQFNDSVADAKERALQQHDYHTFKVASSPPYLRTC
jgi:hypothetical protein